MAAILFQWLREWAPFVLLVLLEAIVRKAVVSTYLWLHARIDRKLPDSMPIGGGDWLREECGRRHLDVRVFVGASKDVHIDASYPSTRAITLSDKVDRKHDPSFWAIAAHELGHALVYRKNIVIHGVLTLARMVRSTASVVARALIIGNVLYANPTINTLAFELLTIGLVAYAVVLVDELLASGTAIHMLAKDPRVDRVGLVGAITALAAAFMTYVGGFTAQVVLLLQRDFIVRKISEHRHFTLGHAMTGGTFVVVGLLSLLLIALSVRSLVLTLRKRNFKTSVERANYTLRRVFDELARGVVGVIIVWLVWDRQDGEIYELLCIAGVMGSRVVVSLAEIVATVIGKLVLLLLFVFVLWWLKWIIAFFWLLFRPNITETFTPPVRPDGPESIRRKEAIDAMGLELSNHPHWYSLAFQAAHALLHIVFVVGVYVSLLR